MRPTRVRTCRRDRWATPARDWARLDDIARGMEMPKGRRASEEVWARSSPDGCRRSVGQPHSIGRCRDLNEGGGGGDGGDREVCRVRATEVDAAVVVEVPRIDETDHCCCWSIRSCRPSTSVEASYEGCGDSTRSLGLINGHEHWKHRGHACGG